MQKDIRVIAEVVNPDKEKHIRQAEADETVCHKQYIAGIIAQSAFFEEMSNVYRRLLSYSDDTNEIYYIANYPSDFIGKPFVELVDSVARSVRDSGLPVLLIGVKRKDGEILLNPKNDSFSGLEPDDELVVMAYEKIEEI